MLRGLGDFITWVTQPVAPTKDSPKALGTTGNPTASKDIAVIGGGVISDALLNVLEKSKVEGTSDSKDKDKSEEKAKSPDSAGGMQREVEKGQAPKDVDRGDKPYVPGQKPHVHFRDGTFMNNDGTTHDAHKGVPNSNNKTQKWLDKHNWEVNK